LQYLSVKNKLISGDEDITFLERTRNGWFCIRRENWKPNITIRFWHRHLPMKVLLLKFWICKSRRLDYVFHLWRFDGENLRLKNTRIIGINTVNKIYKKAGNKFWDSLPTLF
jgi:UDP-2,3-diacylglucosamine hydrolase